MNEGAAAAKAVEKFNRQWLERYHDSVQGGMRTQRPARPSHKYRGYPTITIAAPVVINGVRGNMATTVKETNARRYSTHRIVMPDGSAFVFDIKKMPDHRRKGASPRMARMPHQLIQRLKVLYHSLHPITTPKISTSPATRKKFPTARYL